MFLLLHPSHTTILGAGTYCLFNRLCLQFIKLFIHFTVIWMECVNKILIQSLHAGGMKTHRRQIYKGNIFQVTILRYSYFYLTIFDTFNLSIMEFNIVIWTTFCINLPDKYRK